MNIDTSERGGKPRAKKTGLFNTTLGERERGRGLPLVSPLEMEGKG